MSEEKTSVHTIANLLGKPKAQAAYLTVISAKTPASVGRMVKLDKPETVMGRSTETQLQIEDDGVSRKHAKVTMRGPGDFQLMDLGSTNGTYLNGVKVSIASLTDGDKIQVGSNTVLNFEIKDELEEQYQKNIYESATRDGLTRVFNKKYLMDTLRKEFSYCLRHRVPLSLVMLDVDHFKVINDTYGHPAGDQVLLKLAAKVAETIRQEDVFARYGGEEFVLLLRESAADRAIRCAERCRKAVDMTEFMFNGTPIRVTISLGVATLFDSDFTQPEDLLAAADRYLYRAKSGGRNRVEAKEISGP
jgi:diguanylate cyclase (GGDEF)-like protein